jgi:hypothetical protein
MPLQYVFYLKIVFLFAYRIEEEQTKIGVRVGETGVCGYLRLIQTDLAPLSKLTPS